MPERVPIRCILFDLDGTLVDTAPDLASALNTLRAQYNKPAMELTKVRQVVSYGTPGLLKLGFDIDKSHADFYALRQQLMDLYFADICHQSYLFPGIKTLLAKLRSMNIAYGIVTNKPAWLTDALLRHFPETRDINCVVSGDTLNRCKPHPDPLLHACKQLQIAPDDCLYLGDAEIDVLAARAAGIAIVIAEYGYPGVDVNPRDWRADGYIKEPMELLQFIAG